MEAATAVVPLPAVPGAMAPGDGATPPAVAARVEAKPPPIRTERELRNAYANATDPTDAGLDLAGFLARGERYFEALHVIDQAIQRKRTIALRIARAGLLRDVARCDLAAVELQGVVRETGLAKIGPATVFALAQVEWVAGLEDSARATLRDLQRVHAQDLWMRENRDEVRDWHERIEKQQPGRDLLANGALRDLFALLRAAPIPTARLKLLDRLATPASQDLHDERRGVRIRAIAIACGDESAAVRTRAVQLAAQNQLNNPEFWQAALGDVAPLVRRTAARLASSTDPDAGRGEMVVAALLDALLREADPAVFRALDDALGDAFPGALAKAASSASAEPKSRPQFDVSTEQGREQARSYWQEQCKLEQGK